MTPLQTAKHFTDYISDVLKVNKVDGLDCAKQMEVVYGKEIHAQIDGFIQFALAHPDKISREKIMHTFMHDLRGAFNNDKLMLPRVSGYAEFAKDPDEYLQELEEERKKAEQERMLRIPDVTEKTLELFKRVSDEVLDILDFEPWESEDDDIIAALDHACESTELGEYLGKWGYELIESNLQKLKNWMIHYRKEQLKEDAEA